MDTISFGANSAHQSDAVVFEVKLIEAPPEIPIPWLLIALILGGVVAGTSIAYAFATAT